MRNAIVKLLVPMVMVVAASFFASLVQAAEVGDDGLHKEEWFSETFRDIREDMATAKAEGKRLAIIFEQRGCIYCKKLHETVLSDPEVRDYISDHYMVVQYNMFGDVEVTDLDGEQLSENDLREHAKRVMPKYMQPTHVRFIPALPVTPTNKVEKYKLKNAILSELKPAAR